MKLPQKKLRCFNHFKALFSRIVSVITPKLRKLKLFFFLVRLFVVFGWCIKVHLSFVYSKGDNRLWSISYLGIAKRWIWHICIRYKWWNVIFLHLSHTLTPVHRDIHACIELHISVPVRTYGPTYIHTCIHACIHAGMHAYLLECNAMLLQCKTHAFIHSFIHSSIHWFIHIISSQIHVDFPREFLRVFKVSLRILLGHVGHPATPEISAI